MIKLGVNIDHVATLRNARGEKYPEPYDAAKIAVMNGANSITVHLREDRRHINDKDLYKISKNRKILLNLEMAATNEMLKIALKFKPNYVCIVPEKRKEITTEGGLKIKKNFKMLKKIINKLNHINIRTSVFINPNINDINYAKKLDCKCIEIHTGKLCNLINSKKKYYHEYKKINKSVQYANKLGLEVHAGHGLNFISTKKIIKIKNIKELNIGHFIIANSIFDGLGKTVVKFKKILKK